MNPTIEALRTPEDRFADLPDFDYTPHYVDDLKGYEGLRIHRVDEGPKDATTTYLCLHGEPSWSFLYRHMIPEFLATGARVVAPDFLGFGRSDKPVDDEVYRFHFHRNMLLELIRRLDLKNITLVVQDWGGVLGLTLPHEMPDRFDRLIIMNTALATGVSPGKGFLEWKAYAASQPDMAVGDLMKRSTPHLSDAEIAAYDAPFPDIRYKGGVRRFPEMVMVEPDMEGVKTSKRALEFWSKEWEGDTFMAIGAQDPVLGVGVMNVMQQVIRNCPEPMIVEEAGHFVQEWGRPVARAAIAHFGKA